MQKLKKVVAMLIAVSSLLLSTSAFADKLVVNYQDMGVPAAPTYFKTWMSYKAITNRQSAQYKFVSEHGWRDSEGFMRCTGERDLGVTDDYYIVAMGSYYGTTIGTKYRVTLDTGNVIYVALGDCKADRHTNSTHQYAGNRDVLEFLLDTPYLNKAVKRMGSANVYMPLNGNITKIEKMSFEWVPEPEESIVYTSMESVVVEEIQALGMSNYLSHLPLQVKPLFLNYYLWNKEIS